MRVRSPRIVESKLLAAALATLLPALAFASAAKTVARHELLTDADLAAIEKAEKELPSTTVEQRKALEKEYAAKADRRVANVTDFESLLSPKFKSWLRPKILAIQTGDQLADLIGELAKDYDSYKDPDVQLLANELIQFGAWRGIVYRLVKVADENKVAHSYLLSSVMKIAGALRTYLPHDQWKAAFEFLTEPFDNSTQFKNETEFQTYVFQVVLPASTVSLRRLAAISVAKPIVWDNRVLFGASSFSDDLDRYSLVQDAEKNLMIASKYAGRAAMYVFLSYRMDGLIKLQTDIGKLYGMDGVQANLFRLEGVSRKDLVEEMRKHKDAFTAYSNAPRLMKSALSNLQQAVAYLNFAWAGQPDSKGKVAGGLRSGADDSRRAVNPRFAQAFARDIDRFLPEWTSLVNRRTTLKSRITNETVTVDLPAFFQNPPSDMKDLLPIFPKGDEAMFKTKKVAGLGNAKYRNYFYGSASRWDHTKYAALFPDVTSNEKIAEAQRALVESRGGGLVGWPLSYFIR